MLLSQFRWLLGVAVIVAIMILTWTQTGIKAPRDAPVEMDPAITHNPTSSTFSVRLQNYRQARARLLSNSTLTDSEKSSALEALLATDFAPQEIDRVRQLEKHRSADAPNGIQ